MATIAELQQIQQRLVQQQFSGFRILEDRAEQEIQLPLTYVLNFYLGMEQENTTVTNLSSFSRLAEYVRERNRNQSPVLEYKYTAAYDTSQVPAVSVSGSPMTQRTGQIIYRSGTNLFEYRFVVYDVITDTTTDPYDTVDVPVDIPITFAFGDLTWKGWFENGGFEDVKLLLFNYVAANFDEDDLLDAQEFFATQTAPQNILTDLVQAKRLLDGLVN